MHAASIRVHIDLRDLVVCILAYQLLDIATLGRVASWYITLCHAERVIERAIHFITLHHLICLRLAQVSPTIVALSRVHSKIRANWR